MYVYVSRVALHFRSVNLCSMRATCPANQILLLLFTLSVQIMKLLTFQLSPATASLSPLTPCSSLPWQTVRLCLMSSQSISWQTECIMRRGVLEAVKVSMLVFWAVTPPGPAGRYQHFGETYCQPWRWKHYVLPKCWYRLQVNMAIQPRISTSTSWKSSFHRCRET